MENILFIGYSNTNRCLAAVRIYQQLMRERKKLVHVKSAGIDPFSSMVVDRELLNWADKIFVMENYMLEHLPLEKRTLRKTSVLGIPAYHLPRKLNNLLEKKLSTL